jgi:outer membrane protein assembly factor BamB
VPCAHDEVARFHHSSRAADPTASATRPQAVSSARNRTRGHVLTRFATHAYGLTVRFLVVSLVGGVLVLGPGTTAADAAETSFQDVANNVHRWSIKAVEDAGITRGCEPGRYCPNWEVSRAQMASFLARGLSLPPRSHQFSDVSTRNTHSGAIGALAHAGITAGCAPDRFCPNDPVTRAQMATFLQRALELEPGSVSGFSDVGSSHTHAAGIGAIARAGITSGCGEGRYCPSTPVTRAQMATFLARGLDLDRGLEGCPAVGATVTERFGAAVRGMPLNSGVRVGDRLYVFSLDVTPSRILEYDLGTERVLRSVPVPTGTRTWATHVLDGVVYFGQWGTTSQEANLYRFDPARDDVEAVATVPTGGEFWSLTSDADGLLYAGTATPGQLATIDPETGVVGTMAFEQPEAASSAHVTQLVHHDGRLFLGLGRQAPRLLVRHLEGEPTTEDITPEELRDEVGGIYSLDVDDDLLAVGTQQDGAHLAVLANAPGYDPVHVARFDEEPVISAARIRGTTVYAAGNGTGTLYALDLERSAVRRLDTPVPYAPTRTLLPVGEHLYGVSGAMALWRHDPAEGTSVVRDVTSIGVAGEPLAPQSLSVGPAESVVGVNNAVFLRSVADPTRTRRAFVPGEPKAGIDVGDDHYVVNYPHATLWRVPPTGEPTLEADWTDEFNRPRHLHHDAANRRLLIAARPAFATETSGGLITFDLISGDVEVFADPMGPVSVERATAYEELAIIGGNSANAGVAALGPTGDVVWAVDAVPGEGRVTGLVVAGDTVYGLSNRGWLFSLDARTGASTHPPVRVLGTGAGELAWKAGALYAVNGDNLVAVDPVTYRVHPVATNLAADAFNGPMVRADSECRLYVLRGRELVRISHDIWTR